MFPCACSLRSTQCAALIALTAAAGIARIEPARESIQSAPQVSHQIELRATRPSGLLTLSEIAAPWLAYFLSTISSESTSARDSSPAAVSHCDPAWAEFAGVDLARVGSASPRNPFGFEVMRPSARQHAIPYAVGPPRCELTQTHDAAGTNVPGDSAACDRSGSGIAKVSKSVFSARDARDCRQRPILVGVNSPSFALRGEPVVSFNHRPALNAAGAELLLSKARPTPVRLNSFLHA
jgi:hypothetical protein